MFNTREVADGLIVKGHILDRGELRRGQAVVVVRVKGGDIDAEVCVREVGGVDGHVCRALGKGQRRQQAEGRTQGEQGGEQFSVHVVSSVPVSLKSNVISSREKRRCITPEARAFTSSPAI